MTANHLRRSATLALSAALLAPAAYAADSSIDYYCPAKTSLHPTGLDESGGAGIECRHLTAGDGMVTMADGKPLYVFGFNRLPDSGVDVPAPTDPDYGPWVMEQGTLAANAPAPTLVFDEDDEVFLSLTNVGMAMRPDLFDPHTVHWHGFPQAASVFDGVPDASISIMMGSTLTYYYYARDAGTYMYHCHVEATEHMQMGMLGNLFVRPRQNRCDAIADDTSVPGSICPTGHTAGDLYAYNDGDGSTRYDVEYPIQIGEFDGNFHDASFGVQPLPFNSMRDNYFLLNGRGYPDTVNPAVMSTVDPLDKSQPSQPVSSLIAATAGDRILLRISNLNVVNFNTLGTNGIPMTVIAEDARLLRDGDGNNMFRTTNSVTIGGGQSVDVILDTAGVAPGTYFLYTTNLNKLSNDQENFGGMMTEIRLAAP